MIVGTAVSELIDKQESKMVFSMDEMDNPEARWYLSMTQVVDRVGTLDDLTEQTKATAPTTIKKPEHKKASNPSKVLAMEEVADSDDSSEDSFQPYEKPDSDSDDEEEDATLVNREKATAPVWVLILHFTPVAG